jgi:hypothetical protein
MSSRPLVNLVFLMIAFWAVLFAIWPEAVLIYFAITGSTLALFALVCDVKRYLDNWRP